MDRLEVRDEGGEDVGGGSRGGVVEEERRIERIREVLLVLREEGGM